jgi:hypothetical protein
MVSPGRLGYYDRFQMLCGPMPHIPLLNTFHSLRVVEQTQTRRVEGTDLRRLPGH